MTNTEIQYNLKTGQETNETTYYYFLEVVPPIIHDNGVFQVGEANNHNSEGYAEYDTFQSIRTVKDEQPITKYFYLGSMTRAEAKEYSKVGL